jgi:redox-sensitive bicupin YhaK (pirin superfamily)
MIPPRYQDTASERIPVAHNDDGTVTVKVIAGESLGVKGVIETRIPIQYLHVTAAPGAEFTQRIPHNANAFGFVIEGEGDFGGSPASESQVVLFDRAGDTVRVVAKGHKLLSFLLIAGQPLSEPVARYGPFVMSTRQEVLEAVEDFRTGKMGRLE